ncbi:hypothetical protein [Wolbachia endosymbiont of Folsomia candida]|uniref:hypothetical protein n=1 Tax=Wolbachia endosymbiont of Folsomia candida TaxID=169402 RepID=UPI000A5E138F|nr:hypothetical protein [Wolbachia endosymbiont of Folsomia candida]APR98062.1 hypothetical protein ASM33_01955 [Wolbachia endosymbiont of Folsomia candida]
MEDFFSSYSTFETRVEAAMDAGDVKLVQILWGSKYCQLWQYWAAHAMISYNMLGVERSAGCNLFLRIIKKQLNALNEQKALLNKQENFLEGKEERAAESILETKELLKKLSSITREEAENYTKEVHALNTAIDMRHLFYTPDEQEHNIQNTTISNNGANENNCQDLALVDGNKNVTGNTSYESSMGYISSALDIVGEVLSENLLSECDTVIKETQEAINTTVRDGANVTTQIADRCNSADHYTSGENGQWLDRAVGSIPENITVRDVPVRDTAKGVLAGVRGLAQTSLYFLGTTNDDMNNSDHIKAKKVRIDQMINSLERTRKENEALSIALLDKRRSIVEKVIEPMSDGKPIDKEFMKNMYEILLDDYLASASKNDKCLLYNDIKNSKIESVKEKILKQEVDYEQFYKLLKYAANKTDPDLNIISIFIVNAVNGGSGYENYLAQHDNKKIKKFSEKSINTILMEVHEMLFGHLNDYVITLVSAFPDKEGKFLKVPDFDKIIIPINTGDKKHKYLQRQLLRHAKDIESRAKDGKLNRSRSLFPSMFYFCLCDPVMKVLYSLNGWERVSATDSAEYHEVKIKEAEFLNIILCTAIFNDDGIIYDYLEKIREREKTERNNDILALYTIAKGTQWRALFCNNWLYSVKWEKAKSHYQLGNFLDNMGKGIKNHLELQQKEKEEGWESGKNQAEEKTKQATALADREAKGRQEEAKGRQEAEKRAEQESQRAERLAEALRKAGIDPDTVLQGVNVSQGASTSRSAGVGRR